MHIYQFAIYGTESESPVETKTAALPDDDSAWNYAESIIRGMLRDNPQTAENRLMEVSCGKRFITSIPFDLAALGTSRSLQ